MKFIVILFILYILGGVFLFYVQDKILYHPQKGESDKKNFQINSNGKLINIIVLNEGKEKAIIYFGGNAENMSITEDYISEKFPEYTLYLLEYRGYGKSEGEPSEENLKNDALLLYDKIKDKHEKISVCGRSIGSGIAAYVAANRIVDKLILITPYKSILSLAQKKYFYYPIQYLLKSQYKTIELVKDIKANDTLILVAENDNIIPYENTKGLIEEFEKRKKAYTEIIIPNTNHINISNNSLYDKSIQGFLSK